MMQATRGARRRKVVYLVGEDWFFLSHFLPMGRAARDAGFEVVVLTRPGSQGDALEKEGFRVVTIAFARNDLSPFRKLGTIRKIARVLRRERPDILHNIALDYTLLGTLAGRRANVPAIVNAVTGFGYLAVVASAKGKAMRAALWRALRVVFNTSRVHFLFENRDDAALAHAHRWTTPARSVLLPGAGVDTERFAAMPDPGGSPIRFALVGRMLWQKGPDTAIDALRLLQEKRLACELWLVGKSDPDNPRAVPEDTLASWRAVEGVQVVGFSQDVREVWRSCHIAIAPSRGGEGLPRSLIEAAACGRPLVVTDVPGSRDIARDGENGFVVPADDPQALADALAKLIADQRLRARFGSRSRAIAQTEYREDIVADRVFDLYRRAMPG